MKSLPVLAAVLAIAVSAQAQENKPSVRQPERNPPTASPMPCQIRLVPDLNGTGSHVASFYVVYVAGGPAPGVPTYTFTPEVATWSWGYWFDNPFHIWLGPVAEDRYRITATVPCGGKDKASVQLQGF